jgi:hypothetical protein
MKCRAREVVMLVLIFAPAVKNWDEILRKVLSLLL